MCVPEQDSLGLFVEKHKETYGSGTYIQRQVWKFFDQEHWKEKVNIVYSLLGDLSGKRVLDLGCGVGTFALKSAARGGLSTGLDFTLKMVCTARDLKKQLELSRCNFVCADVKATCFKSNSFDIIIAADIVEHLFPELLVEALSECFRVLKPHGKLLIHTLPTAYDHFFDSNKLFPIVLPFFWLPPNWLRRYLDIFHKGLIPIYFKAVHNIRPFATDLHPNCQTKEGLAESVRKVGFEVRDLFVTDCTKPNKKWKLVSVLFRNHEIAKRNLFLLAHKPQ